MHVSNARRELPSPSHTPAFTFGSEALLTLMLCVLVRPVPPSADPESHRTLDFWLLLVFLTLGTDRKKAAEAILK